MQWQPKRGHCERKYAAGFNYDEDSVADVDFNVVMTSGGEYVEVQGTAESKLSAVAR
jgi:ribonuclease PH